MARLSREQQREYQEELEYRNRIEVPDKKPQKPKSAFDRIVNTVKGAGAKLQEINNSPTGKTVRDFAYKVNSQGGTRGSGKSGKAPSAPRSRTQRVQVIQQSDGQQSTREKGSRIYVIEGKIVASTGSRKSDDASQQRRKRPVGGLGQRDPGLGGSGLDFGNDHL